MRISSHVIISISVISMFVSGCLNYSQVTTLKTDGSGEMFIHYWLDLHADNDSTLFNTLDIFNRNIIKSKYSAPFTNIENVETYIDYSDSTIHGKVKFTFANIDSLNKLEPFGGFNFSIRDTLNNHNVFTQHIPSISQIVSDTTISYSRQIIYYIPGDIQYHNADKKSNNQLIWEFQSDQLNPHNKIIVIYLPFKLKETPQWIYFLLGTVLLIVFVYIFKKRGK
ncbi:MAG: hypothetical protein KAQ90_04470 [Melioribacteraceae bacterium]|nr:hypothetical protein [Melioribacteraceae bacterium]